MDIQRDGCPWEPGPGLPLTEDPVWRESEWDRLLNDLLGKSGEVVDPADTAVSGRSSADGGDWWKSSILETAGDGSPVWDVLFVDEEEGAADTTICQPLPDAVRQQDSSFPLACPQPACKEVQVAAAKTPPGDLSEASVPSAAGIEESVVKGKRSRGKNEVHHNSAVQKPCRAHRAESVGGTEAQPWRSGVEAGTGSLDELFPDTTAITFDDEGQRKRELRLMRNRESACASRSRQKCYVKELEMKCKYLEVQCTNLQQAVHYTAMENVALREELERARKHNGTICSEAEPAALESDSLPTESLPRRAYPCLMANLLSFLIVGLCHDWLGRAFLAMLLAAPMLSRGGIGLVPTSPAIDVAGTYLTWRARLGSPLCRRKRAKKRLRNCTVLRSRA